jgi:hypothetical protein
MLELRVKELSSRLALIDGRQMAGSTLRERSAGSPNSQASLDSVADEADFDVRSANRSDSKGHDGEAHVDDELPDADDEAWRESERLSVPHSGSGNPSSPISPSRRPRPIVSEVQSHANQPIVVTYDETEWPQNTTAAMDGDQEAAALLTLYREEMQQHFPFVNVPPELSQAENRQKRPFLWRAVKMSVVWREEERHFRLGRKLLRDLTGAVLSSSPKSLDTLQSLLVLIAW